MHLHTEALETRCKDSKKLTTIFFSHQILNKYLEICARHIGIGTKSS